MAVNIKFNKIQGWPLGIDVKIRVPTLKGIEFSKDSGIERALKDGENVRIYAGKGGSRGVAIFNPENGDWASSPGCSIDNLSSAVEIASKHYFEKADHPFYNSKNNHNLFYWTKNNFAGALAWFNDEFPTNRDLNLEFENDSDEWILRGHDILVTRDSEGVLLKYVWAEQGKEGPTQYSSPLVEIRSKRLLEGLSEFSIAGIDDTNVPLRREVPGYYLSGSIVTKIFPELAGLEKPPINISDTVH